jgi:hypothetical protein
MSNHKCNVVGCTLKQGSLCGHTLEKCPNRNGKHIAFRNRCVKQTEATKAARQSRGIGPGGRASANAATGVASRMNSVMLQHRPKGMAKDGEGSKAELVDGEEEEEREVISMTESVTTALTGTGTEIEMEALATND